MTMSSDEQLEPAVIEIVSSNNFIDTVDRLISAIESAGMVIFARIDHAAGAQSVGFQMRPTVVLIYGHPRSGTQSILASPLAGLDLPLRTLIRETSSGLTVVAYHPIATLMGLAGVPLEISSPLRLGQLLIERTVQHATC